MFVDFLGKPTYEGDIVIKSSSNRSSSILMIGVVVGKVIWCLEPDLKYNGHFDEIKKVTRVENFYKVESPSEMELAIKDRILNYVASLKKKLQEQY